jgi:hypothetical protein
MKKVGALMWIDTRSVTSATHIDLNRPWPAKAGLFFWRARTKAAHTPALPLRRPQRLGRFAMWLVALTSRHDGGVVQLRGSVVENPHGPHLNTFRFSPKARQIVCSKIIGRPQTGQMTSFVAEYAEFGTAGCGMCRPFLCQAGALTSLSHRRPLAFAGDAEKLRRDGRERNLGTASIPARPC